VQYHWHHRCTYLQATGEDVPLIIRSCIRVINLYGGLSFIFYTNKCCKK